jgi:hypothetical protein
MNQEINSSGSNSNALQYNISLMRMSDTYKPDNADNSVSQQFSNNFENKQFVPNKP